MFTGIIDHLGEIIKISPKETSMTLWIQSEFQDLIIGESIAVDGICLTVTDINGTTFACDLSPETLRLTNARFFQRGFQVNLERALQLSDRLGGHFVLGHVDHVGTIKNIYSQKDFKSILLTGITKKQQKFISPKGSVCINGVSLTINCIENDCFEVMLIPHTLERTNLKNLKANDYVNIEFDYLAKLVSNQLTEKIL